MVSEIIIKRANESKGKRIKIFLNNDFKFEGKLTNSDEVYLEILDDRSGNFKIIQLIDIKEMEVLE